MEKIVGKKCLGEIVLDQPWERCIHIHGNGDYLTVALLLPEPVEKWLDVFSALAFSHPQDSAVVQVHCDSRIAVSFLNAEFINGHVFDSVKILFLVRDCQPGLVQFLQKTPVQTGDFRCIPD